MSDSVCRLCGSPLTDRLLDLGMAPLANALIHPSDRSHPEIYYPLEVMVCNRCFLVQIGADVNPSQLFSHYYYFSSVSSTWIEHCKDYVAEAVSRFGLSISSQVVEIASNDGCLLKAFRERGMSVLGIEPAANVAAVANAAGIPTEVSFFGKAVARTHAGTADLIVANNVLAHVPDINDFVGGMKLLLRAGGTITVEFPHVLRLIRERQFDTIYHEHVFYWSLQACEKAFACHGLSVIDVESLPVHGGSLRVYAAHEDDPRSVNPSLIKMRETEAREGLDTIGYYRQFGDYVIAAKCDVLQFFIEARRAGKTVVGYAAAAKGTSLLNYCGIGGEFISYVVDRSPHKQGMLLPGNHVPIRAPECVFESRPDYLVILAWNLRGEIIREMSGIREWGGRFVLLVPNVEVLE